MSSSTTTTTTTTSTTIPALAKKSVKARCCNTKNDLVKLRAELRQRCKLRMKEQREELLNQRRFGVATDDAVQNKLKEIFHDELKTLAKTDAGKVPERIDELIQKLLDNVEVEPHTEDEKLIVEEYKELRSMFDPES